MKIFLVTAALFVSSLALAADEPPAQPDPKEKEAMKQLMLEDAKKKAAEAAAAKTPGAAASPADKPDIISKSPTAAAVAAPAAETAPGEKPAEKTDDKKSASDKAATEKAANAKAAAEPAAVLPKVEVKKARITVLDLQLQQQDKEIAREQKLTKPTELDKALNGSKVSDKLSILGGQSADYRAGVAQERVNMLKDESDLIEAIAHTKDAKEKAELQKELEELRAYRRDLEKNMR